jgi:hypothetical protein
VCILASSIRSRGFVTVILSGVGSLVPRPTPNIEERDCISSGMGGSTRSLRSRQHTATTVLIQSVDGSINSSLSVVIQRHYNDKRVFIKASSNPYLLFPQYCMLRLDSGYAYRKVRGRNSSVGIATGYGLHGWGSIPDRSKIFLLWTPSRLALGPSTGTSFAWGKATKEWSWPLASI